MAPIVYFRNFIDVFFHYLNLYDSCGKLIWHDGIIPEGKIWVKLGGDHSGGSFKFIMQIGNVANPNSIRNTIPIAVFDCPDTAANLQTATWREHSLIIFFLGDEVPRHFRYFWGTSVSVLSEHENAHGDRAKPKAE